MSSPVRSEMHSSKEPMFHCTACWGYTIHTDCWPRGNPYSCVEYIDIHAAFNVSNNSRQKVYFANPWIEIQELFFVALQLLRLLLEYRQTDRQTQTCTHMQAHAHPHAHADTYSHGVLYCSFRVLILADLHSKLLSMMYRVLWGS